MSDDDLSRFADDDGHPVAKEGLRSLRDERAPDSSLKATLDALRGPGQPAPRPNGLGAFVVWAVVGAVIAAAVAWFVFFR